MELTMKERKSITRRFAEEYKKTTKKEKTNILNNFIKITEYNRSYARFLLRNHGKIIRLNSKTILIGDINKKIKRNRPGKYDTTILDTLKKIWALCDYICGKRLVHILPEILSKLKQFNRIEITDEVHNKLLTISAATIDRLLKNEKKKITIKGKKHTKPGSILKNQIPIRTFADWEDKKPGFLEIDLVGHDGGNVSGDFAFTLNTTDVATGWCEVQAVKNRARIWTQKALEEIKQRLPFKLLGIDSDNDSAFINDHMFQFCINNKITFTRTRSNKKNDNCYVEQKNWSIVRRTVWYYRYDTEEELNLLNKLYGYLRLYVNYFQPSMKLIEKERIGTKIKKKYDKAITPYQRVLNFNEIPQDVKEKLKFEYESLDPFELKIQINKIQTKLINLAKSKLR